MSARASKWLLLALLAALLLPWLGDTLFNTKGEPREAIVAVSMLDSGNWVLPVSYGSDIPYKPPFLAWLIAAFAWLFNGGEVNEYLSRLPSALAAIAMVMGGFCWAAKRMPLRTAWAMAIVTITSFEVFRAAVACRVDMVLTCCMVLALYLMHEWRERKGLGLGRLLAIALLLSGAVLTKGPVGALLPCLAMGIYCLLQGDNFFKSVAWLAAVCIASMAIPAIWYWQAYLQGGSEFLRLALEENIGRLTGTMTYDSHLNPWWYNVQTILAGMLPWTIAALFALGWWLGHKGWQRLSIKWRPEPTAAFAITCAATVFIFYCLPASKRSVYLLPMYPFMALGVAQLLERGPKLALNAQRWTIIVAACVITVGSIALVAIQPKWLPIQAPAWWKWIFLLAPGCFAINNLKLAINNSQERQASIQNSKFKIQNSSKQNSKFKIQNLLALALTCYLAYAAALQPMVLNPKTRMADIEALRQAEAEHGPLYSYISFDPLLRYYIPNFYLGDTMRTLELGKAPASRFCVLTGPDDADAVAASLPGYKAEAVPCMAKSGDTRRPATLIKFTRIEDLH